MTRILLAALLLPLAACSGGEGVANTSAAAPEPVPSPTGPPPRTPRLDVPRAPGNDSGWIGPREAATPAPVAPYGNVLDGPVVTQRKP